MVAETVASRTKTGPEQRIRRPLLQRYLGQGDRCKLLMFVSRRCITFPDRPLEYDLRPSDVREASGLAVVAGAHAPRWLVINWLSSIGLNAVGSLVSEQQEGVRRPNRKST